MDLQTAKRLLDGGFETAELTSGAGNEGAICGMILSFEQNVTLAVSGDSSLATLTALPVRVAARRSWSSWLPSR